MYTKSFKIYNEYYNINYMYFVKNHTKTKKTPPTVWKAQNPHTLDSHIILKLSVSTTKLSTLRGENPAYAALSEQENSDKRKTVLPYKKKKKKKFFHKIFA